MVALALALEALSPSFWVFTGGSVVFGIGFGAIDSALNAHAANHFGARQVNWMHASFGLGATVGPLLVTGMLAGSLHWHWRWAFGAFAIAMGVTTLVLASGRKTWRESLPALAPVPASIAAKPKTSRLERKNPPGPAVVGTVIFTAVETGIESGAGVWGYIFLTDGRGLSHGAAGLVVSAYWAMMVLGRLVLGPVAERAGARAVLGAGVGGVAAGAALMSVPGSPALAVAGVIALGLAASPVFPLITLTTSEHLGGPGQAGTNRAVGLQVAASAGGSAALPAGIGVAVGAVDAGAVGPLLLVLALAMAGLYVATVRRRPGLAVPLRLSAGAPGSPGPECWKTSDASDDL